MATWSNYPSLGPRLAVSLAAALVFLTWGPLPPARGQCDPQELAKLVASDAGAGDTFGNWVALSGDTLVAGAQFDDNEGGNNAGAAYVFVLTESGWTQQAKLTASDGKPHDQFGVSLTLSGDTVVVGAPGENHQGAGADGAAYVFVRSAGVWTEQAKLTTSDTSGDAQFGVRVSLSGDTVVVGAIWDNLPGGGNLDGSAFVFVRTGGVWTQEAKLTASDAAKEDRFGVFAEISDDANTILIGALFDNHEGGVDAGSAYVFVRSDGVWTQQAKLTATDAAAGDIFGELDLSGDGDTAVIGAQYNDNAGGVNAGAAYVFVRSGGVWTQQAKLTASDAAAGDSLGWHAGISGDTAVVGATFGDAPGVPNAGAAYVFVRNGGVWTEQAKLTASDAAAGAWFGQRIAVSGDTALVGARPDDNEGGVDAGSAYVFGLGCSEDQDFDRDRESP